MNPHKSFPLRKTHLRPFVKEEDPQGMIPIQGGLAAPDFHIMPQVEEVEEVEEEGYHLQLQEGETQMIEAMAQS